MKFTTCSGLPGEPRPQPGILGCHADGAGVQVALAHHDAPDGDQGDGAEAELLGPQERRDHDVAPRAHLAVRLDADAVTQPVHHQGLLGIREADLPGDTGVLDGRDGRVSRSPVVAGNEDHVGLALGHAGGNGAHAHFRNQLHRDPRIGVRALQVVDELGEVLDGIDVVVRRRRDQRHPGRGVADLRDVQVHLQAGQLPPFPGFAPCAILICSSREFTR